MKIQKIKGLIKEASYFSLSVIIYLKTSFNVYAAENTYAKAGAEWILDGLFWVVVVCAIAGISFSIIKRNLTGALSTVLGAAIALVIINDPNILKSLGDTLKGILGL